MDKLSVDAFRIVIFLLPGFVTLQVRNMLVVPTKASLADNVILAAVFTFIDHILSGVLPTLPYLAKLETRVRLSSEFWSVFREQGGIALLGYSAGVGLVLGVLRFHGWDYAALRWLRVTRRSGYTDVWNEAFNRDRGSWLIVNLKDGRRVLGWAATYSDEPSLHELFLARAAWVDDEGNETHINGPGILLTEASEILTVEFWASQQTGRAGKEAERGRTG